MGEEPQLNNQAQFADLLTQLTDGRRRLHVEGDYGEGITVTKLL
jgi:hypothetical protein